MHLRNATGHATNRATYVGHTTYNTDTHATTCNTGLQQEETALVMQHDTGYCTHATQDFNKTLVMQHQVIVHMQRRTSTKHWSCNIRLLHTCNTDMQQRRSQARIVTANGNHRTLQLMLQTLTTKTPDIQACQQHFNGKIPCNFKHASNILITKFHATLSRRLYAHCDVHGHHRSMQGAWVRRGVLIRCN